MTYAKTESGGRTSFAISVSGSQQIANRSLTRSVLVLTGWCLIGLAVDWRSVHERLECPRFRGHLSASVERWSRGGSSAPPYPEEFKREAIKLVRMSSKSQHQIAEDLGISDVTLRNWVKQAERDEGKRPDGFENGDRCRAHEEALCTGTLAERWSA